MKVLIYIWMIMRVPVILAIIFGFFYLPITNQPRIPEILLFTILSIIFLVFGIIIIFLMGIELIRKAKFTPKKMGVDPTPIKLVKTGLYKYIRHPIYTGCILTYLGYSLLQNAILCISIITPLFIIILFLKAKQEERDLVNEFKDEYIEYKKSVGMFLPKIRFSKE